MPLAAAADADHSVTPRVTSPCPATAAGTPNTIASVNVSPQYNGEVIAFRALASDGDLDAVLAASHVGPVIVFKHSRSCGVSLMARERLTEGVLPASVHEVVVQQHRDVSNRIAAALGVRHESPQVFVVARGAVTWHSSHNGVKPGRVADAWWQAADAFMTTPGGATR